MSSCAGGRPRRSCVTRWRSHPGRDHESPQDGVSRPNRPLVPRRTRHLRRRVRPRTSGNGARLLRSGIAAAARERASHWTGAPRRRLWLLINLEIWLRTFIDGEGPADLIRPALPTMRLLWIKMGGLWPATSGGRIRSLQTLSHLSTRHQVTVLTTHGPDDDPTGLVRRLPDCRRVLSLPFAAPKSGSPRSFAHWRARGCLAIQSISGSGGCRRCANRSKASRTRSRSTFAWPTSWLPPPNLPRANQVPVVLVRAQRGIPDLAAARARSSGGWRAGAARNRMAKAAS